MIIIIKEINMSHIIYYTAGNDKSRAVSLNLKI